MAQKLLDKKITPDTFISSPAKRAKKTAALFCDTMGKQSADIILVSALYHAPSEVFYHVINTIDNGFNTIAIVAHNPGITCFVNELTQSVQIDNMPTCAVFAVRAAVDQWGDFAGAKKEFLFFDYPKK